MIGIVAPSLANLHFSAAGAAWAALAAAVVLVPLAWWALAPAAPHRSDLALGLGLRLLGIGLLLLCLLDPQWTSSRPQPGANVLAVLADNSQGLQIADAGSAESRGATLRGHLTDEQRWRELASLYQVRRYTFGDTLRRVRDFSSLDFSDSESALSDALVRVRERLGGEPLAGVVIFTDGNATDIPDELPDLQGLPAVFPVVVGDDSDLADARIERVTLRQTPFDDAPVSLRLDAISTDGSQPLQASVHAIDPANRDELPAARRIDPGNGGKASTEFSWRPQTPGLQFVEVAVASADPEAEATLLNNRRIVPIDRGREQYRLLYVGGRINWEFKFLNRALSEDPQLQLVALLRLAMREPKFEFRGRAGEATNPLFRGFTGADDTTRYDEPVLTRLNTRDESELRGGFPREARELFAYDAVILDDVEAGFFSPDQMQLLRRFVSERGGGLLMLGGVDSLEHGGYGDTALAPALPVLLDQSATRRRPMGSLKWQLTREGWLEPWARVRANEQDERERLTNMPPLLIANALKSVKPGATVLATLADETGEEYPALVSQLFGYGRVAVVGAGDLWRWGLRGPGEQADLSRFWRQLSRWLVKDAPDRVTLRVEAGPAGAVQLRVSVRDEEHRPLDLAHVRLTVRRIAAAGDEAGFEQVTLPTEPDPENVGVYRASFRSREAGAYTADVEVTDRAGVHVGHARAGWVHEPAAAEFARLEPNRPLLEEIARRTGGAVLTLDQLPALAEWLSATPAPVMETVVRPIWHNSWVFLLAMACFATEWFWRRRKGLP